MEWNDDGQLHCESLDWKTAPLEKIFFDGHASKDPYPQVGELHTMPKSSPPPPRPVSAVAAIVTSKLHSVNYNAPPKRPQSAYEIFMKVERKRIVERIEESGHAGTVDIPYELAKAWNAMETWEKDVYRNLARMERRLYHQELNGWKERRKPPTAPRLNLPRMQPGFVSRQQSPCSLPRTSPQPCHQPNFQPLNRSDDTLPTEKPIFAYNNYNEPTVYEL